MGLVPATSTRTSCCGWPTVAGCSITRTSSSPANAAPGRAYWPPLWAIRRVCAGYHASSRLFGELRSAKADGSYVRELEKTKKQARVIIDHFALEPLDALARLALLEILEDRHGRASTLMVSQLPVSSWHEVIGEPTIADAICDRIVHGAHRIKLQGDSVRKLYAPACQPGSSRAAGIAPARRHDRDGMERCCRARRSRAPSPPTISPRCCAWLGATDRSLASSSRISPSSIPRSWDSSASHPTAPPLPNSSPQVAIRCRVALQTGNYPHTAGFFADQIAAFSSTRPRAPTSRPLLSTFTSGLSAVRVAPVSYRTELRRHTLHPQVQQLALPLPQIIPAGLLLVANCDLIRIRRVARRRRSWQQVGYSRAT